MASISAFADWLFYVQAAFNLDGYFDIFDVWYAANIADYPSGTGTYTDIFTVLSEDPNYSQVAYEGSNPIPQFYNGYVDGLVEGVETQIVALYTPAGIYYPAYSQYFPRVETTTVPAYFFLLNYFLIGSAPSNFLVDGSLVLASAIEYPDESLTYYDSNFIGVIAGDFSFGQSYAGPGEDPAYIQTDLPYEWSYLRGVIRDASGCICDCKCC